MKLLGVFILLVYFLIGMGIVIALIYLLVRRVEERDKESFEKRKN